MKIDLNNWPPVDKSLVKYPILISDIDEELRDLIYDNHDIEINGDRFSHSIYVIDELSDKYIIDTMTESISLSNYKEIYSKLNKIGITEDNSILLTSENQNLKSLKNVVFFTWLPWEMSLRWFSNIFPYLPYKKSYIEKIKKYRKPYKFLCLNGEAKDFRLMLLDYLHRKEYDKQGLVSLLMPDPKPLKVLEEHWDECRDNPRTFPWDGTIKYPYKFDREYFSKAPFLLDTIVDIPDSGLHNWKPNKKYWKDNQFYNNRSIPLKFVEDTYFGIHPETAFFSSNGTYVHRQTAISEKTCRFLLFQPFIVVGTPFILKVARSFGFKTYLDVLDESYDLIKNDNDRFFKILSIIDDLMSKSMNELHEIFVESLSIIVHNQNVVVDTNPLDFVNKLFTDITSVR